MNKHYSNRQTYKRIVFQSTTNQPLHPIKNSSLTATIKTTDTWKKAKKTKTTNKTNQQQFTNITASTKIIDFSTMTNAYKGKL